MIQEMVVQPGEIQLMLGVPPCFTVATQAIARFKSLSPYEVNEADFDRVHRGECAWISQLGRHVLYQDEREVTLVPLCSRQAYGFNGQN